MDPMRPLLRLLRLLALTLLILTTAAEAEMVLIVHPGSGLERLTLEQVTNIYLGRLRQFPSGVPAQPVDLPDHSASKALFYELLVGKTLPEINAYWARLVFSGRTQPPREFETEEAVVEHVARNRHAIGYVDRAKADRRVRTVLELGR